MTFCTRNQTMLRSTVFFISLFGSGILYFVIYVHLESPPLQRPHNGSTVALRGHRDENQSAKVESILMSPGYILRLPENVVLKTDTGKHVNVNMTVGNLEEIMKRLNNLMQDIETVKEKTALVNPSVSDKDRIAEPDLQNTVTPSVASSRKSFLTLFTTWGYNPQLFTIYNNTVNNCASFHPLVTCIIYTNDTRIKDAVIPKRWKVRKILRFAFHGLPVLKYMYGDAMKVSESEFYVYFNSDILFTDSLIKTLMMIKYAFASDTRLLLITGQRWNVNNVTAKEASRKVDLTNLVSQRGSLFHSWAADYFVYTPNYPWGDMLDLIAGSVGFDNWFIMESRRLRHILIDATATILSIHQNQDNADLHQSHHKEYTKYNTNMIEASYGHQNYNRGQVSCIANVTTVDQDTIVIRKREIPGFC